MTTEVTDLRALPITSGSNFRELGGYQTISGQHIKYHKVLRSGRLAPLNQHDLTYLDNYGVRIDVDLRSADEVEQAPDKVPTNATYKYLPVFDYDQTQNSQTLQQLELEYQGNPNHGHEHMKTVYHNMIADPHAKKIYHQFFELLLSNSADGAATLFHCTAAPAPAYWPARRHEAGINAGSAAAAGHAGPRAAGAERAPRRAARGRR